MISFDIPAAPQKAATPATVAQRRRLAKAHKTFRAEQVAYYHSWLEGEVDRACPLFVDMCAAWRIDVEPLLRGLKPPPDWTGPSNKYRQRNWRSPPLHKARPVGPDGDRMTVLLREGSVEMRAWMGRSFVATGNGVLQLWFPDLLPEIAHSTAIDKPLGDVIDHPLLRIRPYPILMSRTLGTGTVIVASAPSVHFRVPWAS